MPITQKRIYEISLPQKLQNLLASQDHTVTTLKELRIELCNFANEIGDILGVFQPQNEETADTPSRQREKGYREKVLTYLKEKTVIDSKGAADLLGLSPQEGSLLMHRMYKANLVIHRQKPGVNYREFLYEAKPETISVICPQTE